MWEDRLGPLLNQPQPQRSHPTRPLTLAVRGWPHWCCVSLKHLRLICWDNYRVYVAGPLSLREGDRLRLEALMRASSAPAGLATRARIVLLAADGVANTDIADRTGTSRPTVLKWRGRYEQSGVDGLDDDQSRLPQSPDATDAFRNLTGK